MKRSHSFDEFCTEEGLRIKRRKTTEKGGRRHLSGVTTSPSPDSQTTPSVCDAINSSQCNKGTASRNIIAEAFGIAQETGISNVCDATDFSQCKKDTAPRNIIAEAFAIAQETSISDVCAATNVSQCNRDITTKNIIAEAFAISQETIISESNTESYVQQTVKTANLDVHVAQQKQQDCKASGGSVNEADSSAQLLTQADILGVLQGLSNAYNLPGPEVIKLSRARTRTFSSYM
ncbi:uncharacterized protein LOC144620529 [Crassostrea virginica]